MTLKEGFVSYPKILIGSFLLVLITAFFSTGYHNPDEHWQINEFAAYKLGLANADQMPWELGRQARQTIQPAIVYFLSKIMLFLGIFNPFHLAFFLRLVSAILAFIATNMVVLQAKNRFDSEKIFAFCLFLVNFLWFIPYVHVRFQCENWSGIFLAFGVFYAIKASENSSRNWLYLISGICLGIGFDMRFQIIFSIIAVGMWLIFFQKLNFKQFAVLLFGFSIMVLMAVAIDYWYYGELIFMPYRYFYIQLIEHVSDGWGVFPWWSYGELFLMHVAPPLSVVLFSMLIISTVLNYKNLYVWIIWAFVLGHNINGYKEIRYLYPLIPYFCISIFLMFNTNYWSIKLEKISSNRYAKIILVVLLIQNFVLLTISSLKPCNEMIGLLENIYNRAKKQPVRVYYLDSDPYDWGGLKYNFYVHPNISVIRYDSALFISELKQPNVKIILASQSFTLEKKYATLPIKNTYKTVPDWLKYVNINNWLARARVWSLYEKSEN